MFKYLSKNILCKSCLRKNIYLSEQKLKQYIDEENLKAQQKNG